MHATIQTVYTKPVFISSLQCIYFLAQLNIGNIILIFRFCFLFTEKETLLLSTFYLIETCSNRFNFENYIRIRTNRPHGKQLCSDSCEI